MLVLRQKGFQIIFSKKEKKSLTWFVFTRISAYANMIKTVFKFLCENSNNLLTLLANAMPNFICFYCDASPFSTKRLHISYNMVINKIKSLIEFLSENCIISFN